MWFYNLRVASCGLQVARCDFKKINLRVASSFYELKKNFTSWKFILRVGNKTTSWKLLFIRFPFKKIILGVVSCVLRVVLCFASFFYELKT